MSCDNTNDEYHLTPNGWVEGTHYYDGIPDEIVACPKDAIETWVRKMTQSISFAPERIKWELTWTSPVYSDSEKAEIKKRFPKPSY